MTTSDKQANFLIDVARLIFWLSSNGYKATGGELYRTAFQQREFMRLGLSNANHSQHQDKLAIDLNIWIDGDLMWQVEKNELKNKMQPVGDFWESLREGNRWGGNFNSIFDPGHFEVKP